MPTLDYISFLADDEKRNGVDYQFPRVDWDELLAFRKLVLEYRNKYIEGTLQLKDALVRTYAKSFLIGWNWAEFAKKAWEDMTKALAGRIRALKKELSESRFIEGPDESIDLGIPQVMLGKLDMTGEVMELLQPLSTTSAPHSPNNSYRGERVDPGIFRSFWNDV